MSQLAHRHTGFSAPHPTLNAAWLGALLALAAAVAISVVLLLNSSSDPVAASAADQASPPVTLVSGAGDRITAAAVRHHQR